MGKNESTLTALTCRYELPEDPMWSMMAAEVRIIDSSQHSRKEQSGSLTVSHSIHKYI
jgi:hypothetical protein